MDFKSLGRYVILINNKPFETSLPEMSEMVNYAIDEDLEVRERWYTVNGKRIPEVNALWFVKGISKETAEGLDTRDRILLLKDCYLGIKSVSSILKHEDSDFRNLKKYFDDAVGFILSDHPDYKMSVAASIGFSGKVIRLKLLSKGIEFRQDEKPADMLEKLESKDIENLKEIAGEITYCENNSEVTLEAAVNSLKNALRLYVEIYHPSGEAKITTRT